LCLTEPAQLFGKFNRKTRDSTNLSMRRYPEKKIWKNTQPMPGCPEKKLKVSTLPPSDEKALRIRRYPEKMFWKNTQPVWMPLE